MSLGPNIQKLQSFVKSAPNNQLIQFAQNPSAGSDPLISLLAVTELGRRERVRQAMQSPPSPQPTVAQQVVQQAVPPPPQRLGPPPSMAMSAPPASPPMPPSEAGVASLPYEANYADGGIVSFAGSDYGSYVDPEIFNPKLTEADARAMLSPDPTESEEERRLRAIRELRRAEVPYGQRGQIFQQEGLELPPMTAEEFRKETLSGSPRSSMKWGGGDMTPHAGSLPSDYSVSLLGDTSKEDESKFDPFAKLAQIQSTLGTQGGAGSGAPVEDYTKLVPNAQLSIAPIKTDEQVKKEQENRNKLYGVEDIYGPLGEKLKAKEERATQSRDRDRWLSLAQAGLTMAQTPGSFGVALAKGAQAGLGSLADVNKRYEEAQDKIDESNQLLTLAKHQESVGNARDAQAIIERSQALHDQGVNEQAKIDADTAYRRAELMGQDKQRAAMLAAAATTERGAMARLMLGREFDLERARLNNKAKIELGVQVAQQKVDAMNAKQKMEFTKLIDKQLQAIAPEKVRQWKLKLKDQGKAAPTEKDEAQFMLELRKQLIAGYGMSQKEFSAAYNQSFNPLSDLLGATAGEE